MILINQVALSMIALFSALGTLFVGVAAVITALSTARQLKKVSHNMEQLGHNTNSKMDELNSTIREAALARGRLEGRAAQRSEDKAGKTKT